MALNTVKDFATAEKTASKQASDGANTALGAAQTNLAAAVAKRATAAANVDKLKQKNDQLRAQLAAIATPGDATQILKDLSANTIQMRSAQKAYLVAVQQLDIAQRALVLAQVRATRASAAGPQADAQLAWAGKDDSDNDGWRQAAIQAPLTTVPGDSDTVLSDANGVYKKASDRLAADVPTKLLQRALDRGRAAKAQVATAMSRQQAVEDLANKTIKTQTLSELPLHRTAYLRAQKALRDFVTNGAADHKRALDLLGPIPTAAPLSADEKANVTDASLVTPGSAAVDAEAAVSSAADALDQASWTLELAVLTFLATNPDGDPTLDATVQADKADDTAKQAALTAAQAAYTPGMQNDLATWELALPDTTWQLIANFLEAEAILTALKNSQPSGNTGLIKVLGDAEVAYAGALETGAQQQRADQLLQDALSDHADRAAATASAAPAAELSAVRGDA